MAHQPFLALSLPVTARVLQPAQEVARSVAVFLIPILLVVNATPTQVLFVATVLLALVAAVVLWD